MSASASGTSGVSLAPLSSRYAPRRLDSCSPVRRLTLGASHGPTSQAPRPSAFPRRVCSGRPRPATTSRPDDSNHCLETLPEQIGETRPCDSSPHIREVPRALPYLSATLTSTTLAPAREAALCSAARRLCPPRRARRGPARPRLALPPESNAPRLLPRCRDSGGTASTFPRVSTHPRAI
ncbi:hypothetical protein B0H10DRAFT_458222 [Mycena sp. CBHHK59/15]|nr:hypothetical protein B0H10DRAFT_458222 [Mycena sp. CBHHK59/15]